jgi:TPR repeat protein
MANKKLAAEETEKYYSCCGKNVCRGCAYSSYMSGNVKCPFCNSNATGKTDEEMVADMMKRADANDPTSICLLAHSYHTGRGGLQQDHAKAIELYARATNLGYKEAHNNLANLYYDGVGNLKKAKFHYEAAAMAGHEVSRYNLAICEKELGNMDRAVKHLKIGASDGECYAMH